MRYFLRMAIALAIPALVLAGCGTNHNWNRKITVVVDTPSGEVSASSVQWESISDQSGWWVPPEARGAKRHFRGEAVVVELGQHRYLFALLGKPDTFAVLRPGEAPLLVAQRLANLHGAKALPRSEYPTFITFYRCS
jgi:hypothetical protein